MACKVWYMNASASHFFENRRLWNDESKKMDHMGDNMELRD